MATFEGSVERGALRLIPNTDSPFWSMTATEPSILPLITAFPEDSVSEIMALMESDVNTASAVP